MSPVLNAQQQVVGWKQGDVLYDREGTVCAFVRAAEVFTFGIRHVGRFENRLFSDRAGRVVGSLGRGWGMRRSSPRRRPPRQITSWPGRSSPAAHYADVPRPWAIWDGCRPLPVCVGSAA